MPMDTAIEIIRWENGVTRKCDDHVASEVPLEIQVNGESLAVTMRTPGDDFALTAGFLFAEGVIQSADDIETLREALEECNRIKVRLKTGSISAFTQARLERNFLATSSCGVCGKTGLDAVRCLAEPLPTDDLRIPAAIFQGLGAQMRAAQSTFNRTGGLHAAALFTHEGELLNLREDVGRHNAVDKLIGREVLEQRMPLRSHLLMVSGRTSFEILQKAAMARIPVVCAVSAPSSLAVSLARDLNITLIGFLRGDTMNIYTGAERICT